MLDARDEQLYQALKAISEAKGAAGSGSLASALRAAGLQVSEATAGRILRELDQKGLTERSGFKGRVLTEAGKRHLRELNAKREQAGYSEELLRALQAGEKDELVEVLVARRAIERETARLAALNATDEQIEALRRCIEVHQKHFEEGVVDAEDDLTFHRLVSEASHNRVLIAASRLVRQDSQMAPILEFIRRNVGSGVVHDHRKVFHAIEAKDPVAAEEAMVNHIENVIADVKRYWELHRRENGGNCI
ncbi:MAG TPA: FCD domain-containing protein [Firmicutes bacterium]|nr:FCD domain-containing protein [Bacillota bacterium]